MENIAISEWESITPQVDTDNEFLEIVNDFGNPLEILREAISNSIDFNATYIDITIKMADIDGIKRLIITLEDDGEGMNYEAISRDFWGLGYSQSRTRKSKGQQDVIGEKGHGTKIYLRSDKVEVLSQKYGGKTYEAICDHPLSALSSGNLHCPKIRQIAPYKEGIGTKITVIGYNDNERSKFTGRIVKDYILWFTKIGSIELEFNKIKYKDFRVRINCLDQSSCEEIPFGHVFPSENADIYKLFDSDGVRAADLYVKRYFWPGQRLVKYPEVEFDVLINVEGDAVKRQYNNMIRDRNVNSTGSYRVSDRYGIWLCKDYIPVVRANEWITGFGSGSNAFVLLHGFINCQALRLTANRGNISNTDPNILEELRLSIQQLIEKIDSDLRNNGLYTLREWQDEERTLNQEKDDYTTRIKKIKSKNYTQYGNLCIVEPKNESELFGLFIIIYTLNPELFDFELLDYNTNRGIDIIARNKSPNQIIDNKAWYVELKHTLSVRINHAFKYLRWIVCWDFDTKIESSSEFVGVEKDDIRFLKRDTNNLQPPLYFLDNPNAASKIQVINLKEFLKYKLNVEFTKNTPPLI